MRLVSISSRVSWGHVGNAALTFPLQRLGAEVVALDSVLFSNHKGYGSFAGPVLPGAEVAAMLAQLERLGVLAGADGVLSGFLGEAATAEAVADTLARLRLARPELPYLLDPVLGDHGRLYVPAALAEAVARRLAPLANLLTPNRFELELLAGGRLLADEAALLAAARGLLNATTRAVLVTSAYQETERVGLLLVTAEGAWRLWTRRYRFAIAPNGAGDLLAGLWLLESLRRPILPAARQALARLLAVIARTAAEDRRELRLVEAQEELVAADPVTVTLEPVAC